MSRELETRKKMLVAESEVYRQLLKLEIQTFKVYGMRTKRRLSSFGAYLPLMISGLPLLTSLFGSQRKKIFSLKRLASLFFLGWKAYRQFMPVLGLGKFKAGRTEAPQTAAQEYLSKRL